MEATRTRVASHGSTHSGSDLRLPQTDHEVIS
jgi:hypothetical protein